MYLHLVNSCSLEIKMEARNLNHHLYTCVFLDLLEVMPDYKNNNNSFEFSVAKSRSASDPQLYIFPEHELNLLIHEFIFT
jgi:hypothetical protein